MRAPLFALLISLACSAFAADTALPMGTPPGAPAAPAYTPNRAMSVDTRLNNDGGLPSDADTMQTITNNGPADPSVTRFTTAKDTYMRLNNQLGADIRNHASKDTIKQDRLAIETAKKQLDLNAKACTAEMKANGGTPQACQ